MISATYFMLTTLTSIGYGDIYAMSILEKLMSYALFIGGSVFVAYILGIFKSFMNQTNDI